MESCLRSLNPTLLAMKILNALFLLNSYALMSICFSRCKNLLTSSASIGGEVSKVGSLVYNFPDTVKLLDL